MVLQSHENCNIHTYYLICLFNFFQVYHNSCLNDNQDQSGCKMKEYGEFYIRVSQLNNQNKAECQQLVNNQIDNFIIQSGTQIVVLKMGKMILEYLEGNRIYVCKKCHIHLSNYESRISKNFRGGSGQAFLFERGINYHLGQPEDKDLMTGKHTIQNLSCNGCNQVIGWKYVKAYRESEKYKEGKIIIERNFLKRIKWN